MSFKDKFKAIEEQYLAMKWNESRQVLKNTLTSRPIVLYGLGFFGAVIVRNFKNEGIQVECFCDSNKKALMGKQD